MILSQLNISAQRNWKPTIYTKKKKNRLLNMLKGKFKIPRSVYENETNE